ncbi:hypothetical protein HEMROJRC1_14070 [Rodentibacter sp. JRC1]|nr:hypothetical protein HEMROJRC1_14070 [Rodentibacter sp. JRC1]
MWNYVVAQILGENYNAPMLLIMMCGALAIRPYFDSYNDHITRYFRVEFKNAYLICRISFK